MNYVGKSFVDIVSKDIITCNKIMKGATRWGDTEYYICTIKNENKNVEEYVIPTNLIHKMIIFNELEIINERLF